MAVTHRSPLATLRRVSPLLRDSPAPTSAVRLVKMRRTSALASRKFRPRRRVIRPAAPRLNHEAIQRRDISLPVFKANITVVSAAKLSTHAATIRGIWNSRELILSTLYTLKKDRECAKK